MVAVIGADSPAPEPVEYVHHRWPADAKRTAQVRTAMRRWLISLHYDGEQTDDILLAASEAVDNAERHAYPPDQAGPVDILLWTEPGMPHVEVADHGVWCPPQAPAAGRASR